jgi:hypothetical protein
MISRALALGYPENSCIYSWRQEFASNMKRATDSTTARALMAHAPGTTTLEEYYDDSVMQVDVSAIALGETAVDLVDQSRAILYKFKYTLNAVEIEKLLNQAVQDDPDYQKSTTAEDRKRCAKNVRYRARAALRDHCREEYEKNVTIKEFQDRMAQLRAPDKIFQELQEKICQSTATATDDIVNVEQPDLDIGEMLGVRFSDNVGQEETRDHFVSGHANAMVVTNLSRDVDIPSIDLLTDVVGESFESSSDKVDADAARLFLEEQFVPYFKDN